MAGSTIDLHQLVRSSVHRRVTGAVRKLATGKKLVMSDEECSLVAGLCVDNTPIVDLMRVLRTHTPDVETRMIWSLNTFLDWGAAVWMAETVMRMRGMAALPDAELDSIVRASIRMLKGDNRIGGPIWSWPDAAMIEARAAEHPHAVWPPNPLLLGASTYRLTGEYV